MTGDQFTQLALEGTRVEIYWNTRDLKWSVRSLPSGRVIGHVSSIDLDDCSFVVQPAGRERVRREKRKNVHAFVRGTVAPLQGRNHDRSLDVTYNPYLDENFRVISTNEPIHKAGTVRLATKRGYHDGFPTIFPRCLAPA